MGDIDVNSNNWMTPKEPKALPLGKANIYPLGEPHAVSVSLPTWDSVIGLSRKEKWVVDCLEWSYPRFYMNKPIRDLSDAVLQRLQLDGNITSCMVFPSAHAARQLSTTLKKDQGDDLPILEIVRFFMPPESNLGRAGAHWANFTAVVLSPDLWKQAMAFWRDTGSGLSTRHAYFCLEEFRLLDSDSLRKSFRTPAPVKRDRRESPPSLDWMQSAKASMGEVKSFIAQLATSEQPGQPVVSPDDVFLYPNGMNAIYKLSETLASTTTDSTVAAYGWLYPETVEVIRRSPWGSRLYYKNGTEDELDHLEHELKSGHRIQALFCELPSNIKLSSPNLQRICALADKYDFIVACDDTVAGYVNIDALPYVDVMMSSLTKTFSGASNVTGGSLVVNPNSSHHKALNAALSATYENNYFPLDIDTIRKNCKDTAWRVQISNRNTLPIINLLNAHPAIAQVNHPSIDSTEPLYRSVMRKDGGYGNVLSVIFHHAHTAEHFYNILNVCKGSSFGTNFTLAIPYVQLANYWNREKVPKYGVPQHIIRLSVGLEDIDHLLEVISTALQGIEEVA